MKRSLLEKNNMSILEPLENFNSYAVVIRHGERLDTVDENWQWKFYDYPIDDCPLSVKGEWQAERIADEFAKIQYQPRAIFVSPYERCINTIGPAAMQNRWRLKIEPGLGEILDQTNYPPHYLYPFSIPQYYKQYKFDKMYLPVKQAFSLKPEFKVERCEKRVRRVVDQIMMTEGLKGIVYVSHRYVCNMITFMYTGESVKFEPGMMAFLKPLSKRWVVDSVFQA